MRCDVFSSWLTISTWLTMLQHVFVALCDVCTHTSYTTTCTTAQRADVAVASTYFVTPICTTMMAYAPTMMDCNVCTYSKEQQKNMTPSSPLVAHHTCSSLCTQPSIITCKKHMLMVLLVIWFIQHVLGNRHICFYSTNQLGYAGKTYLWPVEKGEERVVCIVGGGYCGWWVLWVVVVCIERRNHMILHHAKHPG